jgi:hypothetical protein
MYGRVVQIMICRGCPLKNTYPVCTACDEKAEIDRVDTVTTNHFNRSLFSISPFWKEKEHESRWREEVSNETAPKGKTIRIPLLYG